MTRHGFLLALAATASLALPGAALADDDDDGVSRVLRGVIAPHYHGPFWDRDDDHRRWEYSYRIRHDDDDDDRWDDDDDDDDDDDRWDDDD